MTRAQNQAIRRYKYRRKTGQLYRETDHPLSSFQMEGRFGPPDPSVVRKQQQSIRNKKVKITLPKVSI